MILRGECKRFRLPVYDHIAGIRLSNNVAGMFYVDWILQSTSMKDGMEIKL